MRNAIAKEIIQKAKENKDFFLIAGDAGLGLWDNYQVSYKAQYLNAGINESCSIGVAAGLALSGKKVVYYNIAPFSIMRPYEQMRNDICYQELPVILIGIGSGLTYAPSGMTHYAIEDIAVALSMPNLQIFSPSDSIEAIACFNYAYNSNKPSYIRIPKAGDPVFHNNLATIDITEPQVLRTSGEDILLLTHSNIANEVLNAGEMLNASVATLPYLNTTNIKLQNLLDSYKYIFVIEEHFEYGGLGTLLKDKFSVNINKIAIPNHYIHKIGKQNFLRQYFGLSAEQIIKKVKQQIRGTI